MAKGASDLVTSLQQAGATIEVASCDVADSKQLEATLQNCSKSLPPIRGVIQGAMVLEVGYSPAQALAIASNLGLV